MAEALPTPSAARIKVPPKYELIMRWLIANPEKSIQEGARQFNVSPGWFSTVVNSDLFIARYQEYLRELDTRGVLPKLAERVLGAAAIAAEKLSATLENTTDPEVILKAADILFKATKPQAPHTVINQNTQTNNFQLDGRLERIQAARRQALEAARGAATPATELVEVAVPHDNGVLLNRLEAVPAPVSVEFTVSQDD